MDDQDSSVIMRSLDVRWPMPHLTLTPEHIQTYPETAVSAILEFPEVVCPPVADSPASAIPEFWLELHFCGHSLLTCDNPPDDQNRSSTQVSSTFIVIIKWRADELLQLFYELIL